MLDWLKEPIGTAGETVAMDTIALRIGTAFAAGFVVAGVYWIGLGRRKDEAATLPTTLVLLTLVIAVVTLVIGNSVARAFGLVGALSIVRFRTVVEDTRDTAFVIFAVVVGMAIGAGYPVLACMSIPAVLLAALVMRYIVHDTALPTTRGTLSFRVNADMDPGVILSGCLASYLSDSRLTASGTAKQGAALELTYRVRLRSGANPHALVAELNRIDGVQGVDLRLG